MADNKVNMSLDDIIKLNKKNKQATVVQKGVQRGGARAGRGGARGGRGGATVRNGSKFTSPRKAAVARAQKRVVNKVGVRKGAAVNEQTKKLVNQLVKKALKTRLGNSVVNRPLAATRGVGVGRGAVVGRLNRTNVGLNRVATRSRVIGKNRAVITSPLVRTVQQRGRGRNIGGLYQDEVVRPVIIQQRPRPVVIERVVERTAPRVIQRVVQRPRQQRVVVQRQPVRQRVIQRQQPAQRVIVVERSAPRVQRVQQRNQFVRQRPQRTVEYVQARNVKNNTFRNALGINSNRRMETVQRFEPSTTFITRKVVRRGRGFSD